MSRKSLRLLLSGGLAAIIASVAICAAYGFPFFYHCARTCKQCGLPPHRYGHDAAAASTSLVAIAPVDQPEVVNHFRFNEQGERFRVPVLRKSFPPSLTSISVDGVTLSRIALSIYSDGAPVCSGLLDYDGGPNGALAGANVVVRLRAYSGTPQQPGALANTRLLWETAKPMWISRNKPVATSLLPQTCEIRRGHPAAITKTLLESNVVEPIYAIARSFDEITHLEVVLEHYEDR